MIIEEIIIENGKLKQKLNYADEKIQFFLPFKRGKT